MTHNNSQGISGNQFGYFFAGDSERAKKLIGTSKKGLCKGLALSTDGAAHLYFLCFNKSTAFVVAAVWTHVVWKLRLVALRADRQVGDAQPLMGASFITP